VVDRFASAIWPKVGLGEFGTFGFLPFGDRVLSGLNQLLCRVARLSSVCQGYQRVSSKPHFKLMPHRCGRARSTKSTPRHPPLRAMFLVAPFRPFGFYQEHIGWTP
jgi:hypothetical protein